MARSLSLLLTILLLVVVLGPQVNGLEHLRDLALKRNIFIGSAANYFAIFQNSNPQDNKNYTTTLSEQFSMITPELSMKWDFTEPGKNNFTFDHGDSVVGFAQKYNQKIRGHNLCWGDSNPKWLTTGNYNSSELQVFLKNHIQTLVSHWKGELYSWDVVNEAVSDSPSKGLFKDNIWYPAIPNYVDLAFQWTREADPHVKLFYNDYGGEGLGAKSDAIYGMIKSMLQRGIPIDGVGLEMHVSTDYYPNPEDVITNIQRYKALGIEVHITEMDVSIPGTPTPALLNLQAQIFGDMLNACLQVPTTCKNFEMWGFTDAHSWVSPAHGDIFWSDYVPKPAFYKEASVLETVSS